MTSLGGKVAADAMRNYLSHDKRQQVLALGLLGWSWCRIVQANGVRRETVSTYLNEPVTLNDRLEVLSYRRKLGMKG